MVAFYLLAGPPLIFKARGRELFVPVLGEHKRPTSDTHLKTAPYWNTDSSEGVWADGDSHPLAANSISAWESAYFGSQTPGLFVSPNIGGGFVGLSTGLKDKARVFPTTLLRDAKETLSEFIESN